MRPAVPAYQPPAAATGRMSAGNGPLASQVDVGGESFRGLGGRRAGGLFRRVPGFVACDPSAGDDGRMAFGGGAIGRGLVVGGCRAAVSALRLRLVAGLLPRAAGMAGRAPPVRRVLWLRGPLLHRWSRGGPPVVVQPFTCHTFASFSRPVSRCGASPPSSSEEDRRTQLPGSSALTPMSGMPEVHRAAPLLGSIFPVPEAVE
jgi:hypothetical protein